MSHYLYVDPSRLCNYSADRDSTYIAIDFLSDRNRLHSEVIKEIQLHHGEQIAERVRGQYLSGQEDFNSVFQGAFNPPPSPP